MKLSLEWITSHLAEASLPAPAELALKLTMATAEVEGVVPLTRACEGIVVGRVEACTPLDGHLSLVEVQVGGARGRPARTLTSVCGAPNVVVGMHTAVALPGARLADGALVAERQVGGQRSAGVLCSLKELGWGDFHAGVIELPAADDAHAPGTPLAELVPALDHVIEIDNKSVTHRADLWGHYGYSRELAAVLGQTLRPLPVADLREAARLPAVPIEILDPAACPGYCGLTLDGLRPSPSPAWMQARLAACGLRPINLLVDLTNYLMLELGQPMHAFDGRRVAAIRVGPLGPGQAAFTTLDGVARPMAADDLMIWGPDQPVAIAGVMGGRESEVAADTSSILLESANFHPARIRRTSVRLGLRTDSSLRFEKGQPLAHLELATARFVWLLRAAGQAPRLTSRPTSVIPAPRPQPLLKLAPGAIERAIGMPLPDARAGDILRALGFGLEQGAEHLSVQVPPHRTDVRIPQDVVEEVARVYGYDNIQPVMPSVPLAGLRREPEIERAHQARRILSLCHGFTELHSYSWFDDGWLAQLGFEPGPTLRLANPSAPELSRLRTTLVPNLLAATARNRHHRDRLALYELGAVYHPTPDGRGCDERRHLAGVCYQLERGGRLQDLVTATKGALQDVLAACAAGATIALTPSPAARGEQAAGPIPARSTTATGGPAPHPPIGLRDASASAPWRRPGAHLAVQVDGRLAGHVGFLPDEPAALLGKGGQLAWFELALDALDGPQFPGLAFRAPSIYPGSWMDFSLLAPAGTPWAEIAAVVAGFNHTLTLSWQHLQRYDGQGLPDGMHSHTLRFWLGRSDRTLTGDELAAFHQAFVRHLAAHDLRLR